MASFKKTLAEILYFLSRRAMTVSEGIFYLSKDEDPFSPRLLEILFRMVKEGRVGADSANESFLRLKSALTDEDYLFRLREFLSKIPIEENSPEEEGGGNVPINTAVQVSVCD